MSGKMLLQNVNNVTYSLRRHAVDFEEAIQVVHCDQVHPPCQRTAIYHRRLSPKLDCASNETVVAPTALSAQNGRRPDMLSPGV